MWSPSPSGRGIKGEGEASKISSGLVNSCAPRKFVALSLTPSLSRWERENRLPPWINSTRRVHSTQNSGEPNFFARAACISFCAGGKSSQSIVTARRSPRHFNIQSEDSHENSKTPEIPSHRAASFAPRRAERSSLQFQILASPSHQRRMDGSRVRQDF